MKLTDNLYFYPENGMLDANTYVVKDNVTVVVDPGSSQFLPSLTQAMRKDGINPEDIDAIVNTHLHIDHYGADEEFKKLSGARILAHPLQKEFYNVTVVETARFFSLQPLDYKEDGLIDSGEWSKGSLGLELIHAPGHSPDSICFYSPKAKFLICGDVLFCQNTGRADLPGGNGKQLKGSIESLAKLDIDYLLPGHMEIVTGAEAVKRNFEFIKANVLEWL